MQLLLVEMQLLKNQVTLLTEYFDLFIRLFNSLPHNGTF